MVRAWEKGVVSFVAMIDSALLGSTAAPRSHRQPRPRVTLDRPFGLWQLFANQTMPAGQGAVSVPALSDGASEPPAVVEQDGQPPASRAAPVIPIEA